MPKWLYKKCGSSVPRNCLCGFIGKKKLHLWG